MSTSALLYLTGRSLRNRALLQVKRLKQPRYVLALLFGGAYVWFFLLRPEPASPGATSILLGQDARTLAALGLLLLVGGAWLSGSGKLALAFAPAEIDFLFPAPLTRRQLVAYKLWRAQVVVLINTLVWVFILKRGGSVLPSPARALSVWALFTTLHAHRIAAGLARASWVEHGRAGRARQRVAAVVFAAALGALLWSVVRVAPGLVAGGANALVAFTRAVVTAPGSWALAPLRWLVAPSFATTVPEWGRAMLPVLAMLVLHVVWVLRADVAFEEAAVEASRERVQRLQAQRTRRTTPAAKKARLQNVIPLAPVGVPGAAIVWKNTLAFARTMQPGRFVSVLLMAVVTSLALGDRPGVTPLRQLAAIATVGIVLLVVLGPRIVRNDLRLDLASLETMKTLPLRGRTVVLAEIASSTLVITALQLALALVAGVAALADGVPFDSLGVSRAWLALAPFALVAVNLVAFTLQNGAAVLVPGWVQTGSLVGGGIEVLGQSLLASVASLLLLVLAFGPPAVAGAVVWLAVEGMGWPREMALGAATVVGLAAVLVEVWLAIAWLGRAFEKTEPRETL